MNEIIEGFVQAGELIIRLDPEVLEITARSLLISLSATLIASLIAIPIGGFIHFREFGGKRGLITIIQTLYALPTVIAGLFVFLLLSRVGPFGFLGLLFTPTGMIIGQTVLVIPLMVGMTLIALSGVKKTIQDEVISLGATSSQIIWTIVKEARFAILGGVILGFGRAISEVGAAMIIGGNIRGYTRILTTAIALETSMGNIAFSIALGIILLIIALVVTTALFLVQER
ncbi:MAG: Molybdate/tungstate transport system permease protein WtpB [Methanoregulaceae archaeon PtaB.Bin009]|jgi:tungstate transport system permease protein|nr:MAG: Molybdate/tungstate transport system permease protein WtpB [Methanoregulaceae archaeon PtaB.Bin009]OPY42496.1 MAG: Molybdate/tungstate transport system permease protein WtpB [Methanoregulaceae archaeon PtaU1.Bin066]HNQ28940.1 ABC transporter permease [Methanolinea sp.]